MVESSFIINIFCTSISFIALWDWLSKYRIYETDNDLYDKSLIIKTEMENIGNTHIVIQSLIRIISALVETDNNFVFLQDGVKLVI